MNKILNNPWLVFGVFSAVLSTVFFFFRIPIFDGEVVYLYGKTEVPVPFRMSLSYFLGIGYDPADMIDVKDFYLTMKGYIMAIIFLFGFPGLLTYRLKMKSKADQN